MSALRAAPEKLRWQDFRWPAVGVATILALCLGHIGFAKHYFLIGNPRSFSDALYLSLQLFTFKSGFIDPPVPWELEVARLLAPAMAAYAAISALAAVFREHFQLLRLRFWRDHVVLCGLGEKGFALSKGLLDRGDRVVIIERDVSNPFIGRCRGPRVIVLVGDATDPEMLRRAGVESAKRLVSVCREDGTNAEVGIKARALTGDRSGGPVPATVHIVDVELCRMLRNAMEAGMTGAVKVDFFNVYEAGARSMFREWPPFSEGGSFRGYPPRMIVVGVGSLGRNLVIHAARTWQFTRGGDSTRLRIACVDKNAVEKVKLLQLREPQLKEVCDLQALQMDVGSPEFEEGAFLFDSQGCCDVSAVYVCFDDDVRSLATGLKIHSRLGAHKPPIVVRMIQLSGLARVLHTGGPGSGPRDSAAGKKGESGDPREDFGNLHAFGLLDRTCKSEMIF